MPDPSRTNKNHPKTNVKFWRARCKPTTKGAMLAVLVSAFIAQTFLVYADESPSIVLSQEAIQGRRVWLENNCQACHQLYGFGGFLGPDLTNIASRIEITQLVDQLALGSGQMPKFDLTDDQTVDLWTFLQSMNESGTGQARNPQLAQPGNLKDRRAAALASIIAESASPQAAHGFEIYQSSTCTECHSLFVESAIGAPDLSRTASTLTQDAILDVLEHGRPPRMPPTGFSEADRNDMHAFIDFMGEHRQDALSRVDDLPAAQSFWSSVPWWEFD